MKFIRRAEANWQGTGKEGKGSLTTQSGTLNNTYYSSDSRFADEQATNPEELIGAAHAGCFTMKLAYLLAEAGFTPTNLQTKAKVTFEDGGIPLIQLSLEGEVPGITEQKFKDIAGDAKVSCPVSTLLRATIELSVKLL